MPQTSPLAAELEATLAAGDAAVPRAAMLLARVETPDLHVPAAMARLDALGARVADRLGSRHHASVRARIDAINRALYDDEGFRGNREQYDDLRNSLLPIVLERRLGIPITLAVIYMSVARRLDLEIFGVAFPGHFLLRVPSDAGDDGDALILDPFDGGRPLTRSAIRALLARHMGDEPPFDRRLLAPCSSRQIIVRMLNNLKRLYVSTRSFPQAWQVTDLLVTLDGRQPEDVRDRGLLAYHLDDFAGALRDLEAYLRATDDASREGTEERRQIWEHVSALRRRVASLN
jgi:regulator of sirC expression with transglutaminase-like and TPR domain